MALISKKTSRSFSLSNISIQQRLPLLISFLIFCIIIVFASVSYWGTKRTALQVGSERLKSLTAQLSSLFSQSAQTVRTNTRSVVTNRAVINYFNNPGKGLDTATSALIQKLRPDSTWVATELVDRSGNIIYQSIQPGKKIDVDRKKLIASVPVDSCVTGNYISLTDTIHYPVIASVSDSTKLLGHIIRWKAQFSTPRSITQFSGLLGSNAKLFIGNSDGTVWSDLIKPVKAPLSSQANSDNVLQYVATDNIKKIATAKPIASTPWIMLIEFPEHLILQPAKAFLKWSIIFGSIVLVIGFILAWYISRKITMPIKKLTGIASHIAKGDFSNKVEKIYGNNELAELGRAFNIMMVEVGNSRALLEKKVLKRTLELENSNKELEAFSYSVSHDLSAPLRIIHGYAEILKTDNAAMLDDEGRRMLNIISQSASRMGLLIDDLLNFSRLGRKQLLVHHVDMNTLVHDILKDQAKFLSHISHISIDKLDNAYCDNSLIRQVWINLISNAIKYSSKNQAPRIYISSKRKNNDIIYCIKDNGVGFDMKYADKLFGVFQRLHNMDEFEGTGVGLALVHRIISKHGGRVWAEAEVDKGASFCFSLPLTVEKEKTQPVTN
jgi:signal transduction histidine kinase